MRKRIIFIALFFSLLLGFQTSITVYAKEEKEFVPSEIEGPVFSQPAGFYEEQFTLKLTAEDKDAKILYTLDGSIPSEDNINTYTYQNGIEIKYHPLNSKPDIFTGTVVRACVVTKNGQCSDITTNTYFTERNINTRYQIPIISLSTDPVNLYDEDQGIFINTHATGSDWEKPMHFEYFTPDGQCQLSMNIGARLHGAYSRDFSYKSLRIYAKKEYDTKKKFDFDFFADSIIPCVEKNEDKEKITEFKRLILRSTGNEADAWDSTYFRDAFAQSLMVNTNLDLQSYQPAIEFINGEYYGIINVRERLDEKYLASHYNIKDSDVAIYEFEYDLDKQIASVDEGKDEDLSFYTNMYDFVSNQDMSVQENYEKVKQWLDIENFIDYQCIEIYANNGDWPGNNCKLWRYTGTPDESKYGLDGKIRFLLFDLDFGFGLYDHGANEDALGRAIQQGSKEWPNQDGATLIFRQLLKNDEFKQQFCNRYLDLINTTFNKEDSLQQVDKLSKVYSPYVDEQRNRYGKLGYYEENIKKIKDFISHRTGYAIGEIAKHVSGGRSYKLIINYGEEKHGTVLMNTLSIDSNLHGYENNQWSGMYLCNIPVSLTAIPDEGYVFAGWSGGTFEESSGILLKNEEGSNKVEVTPIFTTAENLETVKVNLESDRKEAVVKNQKRNETILIIGIAIMIVLILGVVIVVPRIRKNKK